MRKLPIQKKYHRCAKMALSNKGAFFKRNRMLKRIRHLDIMLEKIRTMYCTHPFIDRISLRGNAGIISEEDKNSFITGLLLIGKHNFDDTQSVEWIPMSRKDSFNCRYENHFRVHLRKCGKEVDLFVRSTSKFGKFIKLSLNLRDLGKRGLEELAEWFDETLVHYEFAQFIAEEGCISSMELAIDLVGVEMKDIVLDWDDLGKCVAWMYNGDTQTYYLNARGGTSTACKIYCKSDECMANGKAAPYKTNLPIVRFEKTITTKRNFYELKDLMSTHFKDFSCYMHLSTSPKLPDTRGYWEMFLSLVSSVGVEKAIKSAPADKRLSYRKYLDKSRHFPLEEYLVKDLWRASWSVTLRGLGISELQGRYNAIIASKKLH